MDRWTKNKDIKKVIVIFFFIFYFHSDFFHEIIGKKSELQDINCQNSDFFSLALMSLYLTILSLHLAIMFLNFHQVLSYDSAIFVSKLYIYSSQYHAVLCL